MDATPSPHTAGHGHSHGAVEPASRRNAGPTARPGYVLCPLCTASVKIEDAKAHYNAELVRLRDPAAAVALARNGADASLAVGKRGAALHARRLVHSQALQLRSNGLRVRDKPDEEFDAQMAIADGSAGTVSPSLAKGQEVLRRVRRNRRERTDARGSGGPAGRRRRSAPSSAWADADAMGNEVVPRCPICADIMRGDEADINAHIDGCLANGGASSVARSDAGNGSAALAGGAVAAAGAASGTPGMDDGERPYEVYTWAGQTRVRASTLVVGGLANAAAGVHSSGSSSLKSGAKRPRVDSDEEADIDVDDDSTAQYGEAQYGESAIVRLETAEDGAVAPLPPVAPERESAPELDGGAMASTGSSAAVVIASLKSRIRELEGASMSPGQGTPRCLICMERYTQPLVSVLCWHVHCERCWLQTLGVKRLCPQCNTITAPPDLRKIYL